MYNQTQFVLEKQAAHLWADVTFGASGAPSIASKTSLGIKSVTRTSAGLYVIAFNDAFVRLLSLKHITQSAAAPAAPGLYVVSTSLTTPGAATLTVQFNSAGVATDPAAGEIAKIHFEFSKSTV